MAAELFAGTSGFAYPQWKPDFCPPKLPAKQFLKHYAGRLNSVEINHTFRRFSRIEVIEEWGENAGAFSFFVQDASERDA